ncbi:hypothetical protein HZC30_07660 [Candidatus Woesearchaeota archaeon]|nr:hypothetical protein [Candidatus Woesearchaeota archaeon]
MVIFKGLFEIWDRNKAHVKLQDTYSEIDKISRILAKRIKALREVQKVLVSANQSLVKFGPRVTGSLSLEKTEFLEEYLVHKLEKLAEEASKRWEQAVATLEGSEPIDPQEQLELQRIKQFLDELMGEIPEEKVLHEMPTPKEKLEAVGRWLREATDRCKEVWMIKKHEGELQRTVADHEIPVLIRTVYNNAHPYSGTPALLVFPITEPELKLLESEAEKINACQDKNYHVGWRKFWRPKQEYETDDNTPLKEPHINVAITLNGSSKEIHLLQAA